jgi:hypothetical protein
MTEAPQAVHRPMKPALDRPSPSAELWVPVLISVNRSRLLERLGETSTTSPDCSAAAPIRHDHQHLAKEALPYEYPRLEMISHIAEDGTFAERLERALTRSNVKVIKHRETNKVSDPN